MSAIFIRKQDERDACGIVRQEDLELKVQLDGWSVYLTQQNNWIVKLPPQMMAGIPYILPNNETLLNLLLRSLHRETDEEIRKKIEELTY